MELTIFWAPWCNLSCEVLTRLNSFVVSVEDLKTTLTLVAPYEEKIVMPVVESQKWSNLNIICDPQRSLYDSLICKKELVSVPYAVLTRGDEVIWEGRAVSSDAASPLEHIENILKSGVVEDGLQIEEGALPKILQVDQCNDPGKDVLTSDQVKEDLRELHNLIKLRYGGYDCNQAKLLASGSSWDDRVGDITRKIEKTEKWAWGDVFSLFNEFLKPVEDAHFLMTGRDRMGRFIVRYVPFFADITVNDPESLDGIEILGSPHDTVPLRPYLFPALHPQGTWLLGVLADKEKPPSSITVTIKGKTQSCRLHRGKIWSEPDVSRKWKLISPPESSIPVLEIPLCTDSAVEGAIGTARTLRDYKSVILDLRGNCGGQDGFPAEWVQRFSKEPYKWVGASRLVQGETDPLKRWISIFEDNLINSCLGLQDEGPDSAYSGQLFVLTDGSVASSGESLTQLASQVSNAILVGENTLGCIGYGCCAGKPPLNHSKIQLRFGVTRFIVDGIRHNREGFGYYPDYWVDSADPVRTISEYWASN